MKKRETNVKVVTWTVFIATFMTAIEATIVSTAMPTIVGSLHGISIMNWVFSIYLLTNAMMTPIYGKLADRIGRKPIFLIGIFLFIIGSCLCGFAQDMMQLIVFRAIQGVGAGAIMPVALTIIADIYPVDKRAKVLGMNNAFWGIASVVGPLCGGFIVDVLSWHWIFFVNVPISIILVILISVFLVEPKTEGKKKPVDVAGSFSLMIVLLTLLYGFQTIGNEDGVSMQTFISFGISIIAMIIFIAVEKRAEDPVISLDLFTNGTFVIVNVIAALVSGFLMGVEVYLPMWLQGILGLKAAMGGMALAPLSITWVFGSLLGGKLMASKSTKMTLNIGVGIILIGGIALSLAPSNTSFIVFALLSSLMGIGLGVTITTCTVKAQSSVTKEHMGVATSFNTLCRTIGQTIMVSVFGVVLNSQINKGIVAQAHLGVDKEMINQLVNPHTAGNLPKALLGTLKEILYGGIHNIFLVGTVLLILSIIINQFQKSTHELKQ